MEPLKSFEELNCWKEAVLLRNELMTLINALPKQEEYRLKDQMIRCLRSVTNNIAEGYGRFNTRKIFSFAESAGDLCMKL
jgi:four helix bundle protein